MSIFWRSQRKTYVGKIGDRHHTLGPDRVAAQAKYEVLLRGETLTVKRVNLSVSGLTKRYLAEADLAKTTRDSRQLVLNSLSKYWNGEVSQLTPETVRSWLSKSKLSSTTKHTRIGVVSFMLNWAVAEKLIEANPIKSMKRPRPQKRERFLTDEEVAIMLSICREPFTTFVRLGLATGMRCSELIHLESRHLKGNTIVFPRSEAKGRRSARTVWLSDNAKVIIDTLPKEGRLLRNSQNVPWNKDSIRQRFEAIQDKLGWPVRATELRHKYAVDKLNAGVDPMYLAKLMGHTSVAMIFSTYGHLCHQHDLMAKMANK